MGLQFGRVEWIAAHGVNPDSAWMKLLDRFSPGDHERTGDLVRRDVSAGLLKHIPDRGDLGRYLERARNSTSDSARIVRRTVWRGTIFAQMNTAAAMAGLVAPRGQVTELSEDRRRAVWSRVDQLLEWTMAQEDAGTEAQEINAHIGREADALMGKLT